MPAPALPDLSLAADAARRADVLVVGLAASAGGSVLVGVPDDVAAGWGGPDALLDAATRLGAKPEPGTTVALAGASGRLVVTGIGDVDVTPDAARRGIAAGVRRAAELAGDGTLTVAVSLDTVDPEVTRAAAEGALLASHRTPKVSGKARPAPVGRLWLAGPSGADAEAAVAEAAVVARAVCQAREWVNQPANDLFPESFAEEARRAAKGAKLDVTVLDEKALARDGYGGLSAVGGGSSRPPRLVRVEWAPRGATRHLALVGKGVTFDSGGLDLKPAEGMYTMKCDMAGAAAVIAATRAIADLGLKVRVTAWAAMAENMPSGSAYRPSDVLTMYGGTTVENANTDAEGRLVMADAIARASEDSPDLIVDVATLTGACMVALGERTGGVMASNAATADLVLDAAESAGEAFWQLPIPAETADNLLSEVADLRSSGTSRYGGALNAAAFLHHFVGDGIDWAHLDIAGPAWSDKARDEVGKGGTGASVRTLVALARALQV